MRTLAPIRHVTMTWPDRVPAPRPVWRIVPRWRARRRRVPVHGERVGRVYTREDALRRALDRLDHGGEGYRDGRVV